MGVITTDSMAPLLEVGIAVRVLKKTDYSLGSLLLFKADNQLIIHRLIKKLDGLFITKGDNSWKEDVSLKQSDILGQIVTIYDEQMRVISLPSKREKLFFIIDSFVFQHRLMRYKKFRWFRYYVLRFLKRKMWPSK